MKIGIVGPERSRRAGRWRGMPVVVALALCAGLLGAGCGHWSAVAPSLAVAQGRQTLFQGVSYAREELAAPRTVVLHVVTIDLKAPGIRLLVTPGDASAGRELRARTTSQFLKEFGAQVAVNGGFFEPFSSNPLSYYPRAGDSVDVLGLAISNGAQYSEADANYDALFMSKDNRVSIGETIPEPYNAISGKFILVKNGVAQEFTGRASAHEAHPRTAVGVDKSGRYLTLFVADGRQAGYSEGLTLPELAEIIVARGGYNALNLDGGGSTALVMEGPDGQPKVVNSPINQGIPGSERAVANHLGVFAQRR